MSVNTVGRLLSRHLQDLKPGQLDWIGLRPERKVNMQCVTHVEAVAEMGLAGDRRCKGTPGSARQVTLINREHIDVVASLLALESIDPAVLRRNLVVSGINLMALRHQRFRIGEVEFEATAQCHPCVRMEQALGKGAVAAMLGHGGVCAKIIKGGVIALGDEVAKL
ncbi:MOSC domain-containing protein [Neptunomonas antarctica]|uniref:MOSC domain-containing protein n=1 Tax=Neptunomonas antarctica TaxID=619304 RepID=UPI0006C7A727|nr:MOSC domain-containing protein [Neptunomonas antarctica]